jgi:hypothetical protein
MRLDLLFLAHGIGSGARPDQTRLATFSFSGDRLSSEEAVPLNCLFYACSQPSTRLFLPPFAASNPLDGPRGPVRAIALRSPRRSAIESCELRPVNSYGVHCYVWLG